jgi:hypothetical protein
MMASDDPKQDSGSGTNTGVRALVNTLAQMQLAGLMTGSAFLSQWTVCTIGYGEQVGKILRTVAQGQENYGEAAAEVLDMYRKYLQQTLNLSSTFGLRFYHELDKIRRTTASGAATQR